MNGVQDECIGDKVTCYVRRPETGHLLLVLVVSK